MKATTLRKLFEIRDHNRTLLDGVGALGTALGLKNGHGDPSILVYVSQKIGEPWLASGKRVPPTLTGEDGTTCSTDVIGGASDRDLRLRVFDRGEADLGLRPLGELVATNPLGPVKLELRDQIRGNTDKLRPGCQLSFRDDDGVVRSGTLACFARDTKTQRMGLLTNHHIGKFPGNVLSFPDVDCRPVAVFKRGVLDEPVEARYGKAPAEAAADAWQSRVRIDAGFCELVPSLDAASETDRLLPTIEKDTVEFRQLGSPFALDLDAMAPVGAEVVGVGRTRSCQSGTIQAFSFEYLDSSQGIRAYTDYLIVGDEDDEFSDPGDSGKLVVLKNGLEPVAIMWGGEWSRRRHGRELENWTNATDLGLILKRLEVDVAV